MLTKASMLPLLLAVVSFNAVSTPLTWLDKSFVESAFVSVDWVLTKIRWQQLRWDN